MFYTYGVDIARLPEVHLLNSGSRYIQVLQMEVSYWIYHSGPEDNSVFHGVAIALKSGDHNILISWEIVSPRFAVARFRSIPFDMTVFSVYALTLKAEPNTKDVPYC